MAHPFYCWACAIRGKITEMNWDLLTGKTSCPRPDFHQLPLVDNGLGVLASLYGKSPEPLQPPLTPDRPHP
jgi:hypothetical protein